MVDYAHKASMQVGAELDKKIENLIGKERTFDGGMVLLIMTLRAMISQLGILAVVIENLGNQDNAKV